MNKRLLVSLLVMITICSVNNAFAEETTVEAPKANESTQLTNIPEETFNVVSESGSIQIVKQGEKYALYNKDTQKYIVKPIIDDIKLFDESQPNIFKIQIGDNIGFIDLDNDTKVLTQFEELTLLEEFIKIKKGNKYGLMSRKAELIIPAEFDRINIISNGEEKFITAKEGTKYKVFSLNGKEIEDKDLYQVNVKENEYSDLIQDLKPEIYDYVVAQKNEEQKTIEEKLNENVHTAVVEKNVQETEFSNVTDSTPPETATVNYGNLQFYVVKKNNKIGLNDINGFQIAPMSFDKIDIDTPCKHFKEPIVICKNEKEVAIYNIRGKKLGYMKDNIAHVFWNRNSYKYVPVSDKIWEIKLDKKEIGRLVKEDTNYRFTKTGFSFLTMHKANEIFLNLLSI